MLVHACACSRMFCLFTLTVSLEILQHPNPSIQLALPTMQRFAHHFCAQVRDALLRLQSLLWPSLSPCESAVLLCEDLKDPKGSWSLR